MLKTAILPLKTAPRLPANRHWLAQAGPEAAAWSSTRRESARQVPWMDAAV